MEPKDSFATTIFACIWHIQEHSIAKVIGSSFVFSLGDVLELTLTLPVLYPSFEVRVDESEEITSTIIVVNIRWIQVIFASLCSIRNNSRHRMLSVNDIILSGNIKVFESLHQKWDLLRRNNWVLFFSQKEPLLAFES
jgi:hypothetical protein